MSIAGGYQSGGSPTADTPPAGHGVDGGSSSRSHAGGNHPFSRPPALAPRPVTERFLMLGAAQLSTYLRLRSPSASDRHSSFAGAYFSPQSNRLTHPACLSPCAAIFCAGSFGSALGWLSLAPITDLAEEAFGVGPGGVNLISNTFLLLYIPGSLLSLYCVEAYGLSRNITIGIVLTFIMTVVKSIGVSLPNPKWAYLVTLLGQAIGGLGEPLILNVAARLSMDW